MFLKNFIKLSKNKAILFNIKQSKLKFSRKKLFCSKMSYVEKLKAVKKVRNSVNRRLENFFKIYLV